MEQLRYGILSTSSIAPRFIAAVRQAAAGEILALSSRTLTKAKEKAAHWEVPRAYGSHEELLADKDVNIVYISTVNALHYTWAKAALEAGKHVICEKPCTTTADQTRELYALARQKQLFFHGGRKNAPASRYGGSPPPDSGRRSGRYSHGSAEPQFSRHL